MKTRLLVFLLVMGLAVGTASAQFGSGIVYDPTNYHNALLRYFQLQQHLIQLQKSYAQLVTQYNFALRMAQYVQNMPARYRARFSTWRNALAPNTYGNTGTWITGINSGQLPLVNSGYQRATTQLLQYDSNHLSSMHADELSRVQSQYASVELADGANMNAMATVGSIRGNAQSVEAQIAHLEKQLREATTNASNADISRRANLSGNILQVTSTLTDSLQNFRMP